MEPMVLSEGADTSTPTEAVHPRGIDITPTWSGVLPIFLAALEYGTKGGRTSARVELARMARLADMQAQSAKVASVPTDERGDTPLRIDITPTWQGILPALIALMEDGTDAGRREAQRALVRMAKAADVVVVAQKAPHAQD